MARTHAQASNGLQCRIGNRDRIRPQGERFDEVRRQPQTTGDDQCHIAALLLIEEPPGARQCGNRRHRYVVPEQQRRRTRATATAIEDDVVDPNFEGGLEITLNVLGGKLDADRDPTRRLANLLRKIAVLVDLLPIGKAGW